MALRLVDIGPLIDVSLADARPELQEVLAPATHPVVLLPVRIETRFFETADGQTELRVRVYPDRIHIDAHDPGVTDEEAAAGRAYWEQAWRAMSDEPRLRAAWQLLTERLEAGRAAYVAHALTPTNPGNRPRQPLPPEADLPVAPDFPDVAAASAVTRTPVARALPRRWTAVAYRDGAVVGMAQGQDIAAGLAVGPDLAQAAPDDDDHETAPIDVGMAWMVDFEAAERKGMALRLLLPGPRESAAVDVLLVSGVGSSTPEAGAEAWADLVDAHRFTEGFAVLEPGVPTNNTTDERSGFSSRDLRGGRSFGPEWSPAVLQPGEASAADVLADAWGLDPGRAESTLGHLAGAEGRDRELATAMTTSLWPATWGYYLTQMVGLGVGGLSVEDCDWARDHARRHLAPGGPLPALRCANQPYGVLPVTSLNAWVSSGVDASRQDRLRGMLTVLRDGTWRPAQAVVARVGRSDDDPDGDLLDVLRTDAVPAEVRTRRMMGPHFLRNLHLFLGDDLDAANFWLRLQALSARVPRQIGLGFVPLISRLVYEAATSSITVPLVAAPGEAASYLAELAGPLQLQQPAGPVPLLRALARHAMLRAHAEAAARLLAGDERPLGQLLRDAELVDLVPGEEPTHSWSSQRQETVPGSNPPVTVAEALDAPAGLPPDIARPLEELRDALGVLSTADTAAVERHLRGTLASTAYRLDAWATSLATRRLAEVRAAHPTGVVLGGYGWVENLAAEPRTEVAELPPDEDGPLFAAVDDPGFIHAPSLDQASTAALLRNAHLAHGGGADDPYAIRLTSQRVRTAQRLLDGVRQGQALGALLGYDFERRLHDTALDRLLDDFRKVAPPAGRTAEEAVERRVLLDGLVLRDKWVTRDNELVDIVDGLASRDHDKAVAALDGLVLEMDAVADAITAEGVHQMVRGSADRASATLEDVASGDAAPPRLDLVRTPRSGLPVTHRVAIVLDPDADVPAGQGWAAAATSPRAAADPALNAWLARLLGPANDVDVLVTAHAGETAEPHRISLAALELTPLDLAWLSGDPAGLDQLAELAYPLAVEADKIKPGVRLELTEAQPTTGQRAFSELLELARSAMGVFTSARPLDAVDLQPPHADVGSGVDLTEYAARAASASTSLRGVHYRLDQLGRVGAQPRRTDLRDALRGASAFRVPAAGVPFAGGEQELASLSDDDVARTGAPAVVAELARRLTAADAEAEPVPGESGEAARLRIQRQFAAVFGRGFVPLPRVEAVATAELRASARDPALTADDPVAAYTWLLKMARLRPGLNRLDLLLSEAEGAGSLERVSLAVAQLPHEDGQRWVGLSLEEGTPLREGVVSLVLHDDGLDRPDGQLAGMLVDEWAETVPARSETTAVAFRYDPPDAAAPQAVLVAVPPDLEKEWTVGTLHQVLLETLDLAHLRAVGPEELDDAGHYLPAATLAFNAMGDVVSTDLNPLVG